MINMAQRAQESLLMRSEIYHQTASMKCDKQLKSAYLLTAENRKSNKNGERVGENLVRHIRYLTTNPSLIWRCQMVSTSR